MKPRAHSSILLLVTLIIGMLLGALIHSNIRSSRMKHFSIMHSKGQFIAAVEEAIAPLEESKAAPIRKIITESAGQIHDSREKVRTELETLQKRLSVLLDEDQQERLRERLHPPRHREKKPD